MKKTIKKILSIFAAFFLVLGLTTGVRAEEPSKGTNDDTGEITVTNPIEGKTYSLYQLLVLESYNTELDAYSYTVANGWENFFNNKDIKEKYIKFDATGKYVTWVKDADAVAFSKKALDYAKENNITVTKTSTATKTGNTVNPIVFDNLNLGYYLLDSSAGALCSLQTTNPTVTITEKNSIPTVEKEVKEDSTNSWEDKNDAQIGDTVEFKATINVGNNTEGSNAGAQNYVLHDTMSDGLTFSKVTKVILKSGNVETEIINSDELINYEVKTENIGDETFNVEFTKSFCDTLQQNDVIIVYYEAVINENAVIAGNGNDNKVNLTYGDKNEVNKTPDSTTKTFTWPVGIYKYADKEGEIPLVGAQFQLKTSASEDETALKLLDVTGGGEKAIPTYRIATQEELSNEGVNPVETITTNDDGKFVIQGLNAGKYYLHETKAPDGYNKLAAPIEITITSDENNNNQTLLDYTVTSTGKDTNGDDVQVPADLNLIQNNQTVKVLNTTGAQLPETGGMGTTILYVVGGILLVGSAILLVTRKRMSH